MAEAARRHGFTNVTALEPWDSVDAGGDTMLIPELAEIPERLGHISLALLPTNGLLNFQAAACELAPDTTVRIIEPGTRIEP